MADKPKPVSVSAEVSRQLEKLRLHHGVVVKSTEHLPSLDEEDVEHLARHLSCGGTLRSWCENMGLSEVKVRTAIVKNPDFMTIYERGIMAGEMWTRENMMALLNQVAFFDIGEAFDEHGSLKDPSDWPEGLRKTVQAVSWKDGAISRISFPDRLKAIELVGRLHGQFVDRHQHQHSHEFSLMDHVKAAQARALERRAEAQKLRQAAEAEESPALDVQFDVLSNKENRDDL